MRNFLKMGLMVLTVFCATGCNACDKVKAEEATGEEEISSGEKSSGENLAKDISTSGSNPIQIHFDGSIAPNEFDPNSDRCKMSFNRFPNTKEEFLDLREKIGTTPEGSALLFLMSMELYRRNKSAGEQCVNLMITEGNHYDVLGYKLPELFRSSDKYYDRPYQVAGMLQGTSPEKGYNLTPPYKFEVMTLKDNYREVNMGGKGHQVKMYIVQPSGVKSTTGNPSIVFVRVPATPSVRKYFIGSDVGAYLKNVEDKDVDRQFNGLK